MLYVTVNIECDECAMDESVSPPKHRAVSDWRAEGWRIGKRVLCPGCASSDGWSEES